MKTIERERKEEIEIGLASWFDTGVSGERSSGPDEEGKEIPCSE